MVALGGRERAVGERSAAGERRKLEEALRSEQRIIEYQDKVGRTQDSFPLLQVKQNILFLNCLVLWN